MPSYDLQWVATFWTLTENEVPYAHVYVRWLREIQINLHKKVLCRYTCSVTLGTPHASGAGIHGCPYDAQKSVVESTCIRGFHPRNLFSEDVQNVKNGSFVAYKFGLNGPKTLLSKTFQNVKNGRSFEMLC